MKGRKVIVRSDRAGVFFGTLKCNEDFDKSTACIKLYDSRRIWYWKGAASISQLAIDGTKQPDECKFTVVVPEIEILGVIEVIPCTEKAINCIEGVKVWKL